MQLWRRFAGTCSWRSAMFKGNRLSPSLWSLDNCLEILKTGTAGGEMVAESHGFSTNLFHLYAGRLMGGNRKHLELLIGILIKVELITICIWILLLNLAIQTLNKRQCINNKKGRTSVTHPPPPSIWECIGVHMQANL